MASSAFPKDITAINLSAVIGKTNDFPRKEASQLGAELNASLLLT